MDPIKLATPEQIAAVKDRIDLEIGCAVYAFGDSLACVRTQTRLDPVIFSEKDNTHKRLLFVWGLETAMRLNGVPAYYFNVPTSDPDWIRAVEHNGAERLHTEPMLEYKKVLN